MTKIYMLLLESADGSVSIAKGLDDKSIVAYEGNQYLLEEIGQRLLDKNLTIGYQLVTAAGPVVRA